VSLILHGVTEVYSGSAAKNRTIAEKYSIGWEIMFSNNEAGKKFANQLSQAFKDFPDSKGIYMLQGESNEIARCAECFFTDTFSFKKVLNQALSDITIFDEEERRLIPRSILVKSAEKLFISNHAIAI